MILPEIRSHQIDQAHASFSLVASAELEYFKGHFPGFPVLPGVIQIGWAKALAELHFGERFNITGMRKIKFMRLIHPEQEIALEITLRKDCIEFRYQDAAGPFSSGALDVELRS